MPTHSLCYYSFLQIVCCGAVHVFVDMRVCVTMCRVNCGINCDYIIKRFNSFWSAILSWSFFHWMWEFVRVFVYPFHRVCVCIEFLRFLIIYIHPQILKVKDYINVMFLSLFIPMICFFLICPHTSVCACWNLQWFCFNIWFVIIFSFIFSLFVCSTTMTMAVWSSSLYTT